MGEHGGDCIAGGLRTTRARATLATFDAGRGP